MIHARGMSQAGEFVVDFLQKDLTPPKFCWKGSVCKTAWCPLSGAPKIDCKRPKYSLTWLPFPWRLSMRTLKPLTFAYFFALTMNSLPFKLKLSQIYVRYLAFSLFLRIFFFERVTGMDMNSIMATTNPGMKITGAWSYVIAVSSRISCRVWWPHPGWQLTTPAVTG